MLTDLKKFRNKSQSHAVIISSRSDSFDVATQLAMSHNCAENSFPCGQCASCIKTKNNVNPDVCIVDFDDKNIPVDEIRRIKKDAYIKPNECDKKIYIIKNGENLGISAQNALLKLLEEPPIHACFIILCSDEKLLLNTILSRCSLVKINDNFNDFDDNIVQISKNIMTAICQKSEISLLENKVKNKQDFIKVISIVKVFLRDALVLNEETNLDFELAKKIFSNISPREIFVIYNICNQIETLLEFNVSPNNLLYYFATELYK